MRLRACYTMQLVSHFVAAQDASEITSCNIKSHNIFVAKSIAPSRIRF